jgi:5-methyltetrahydropteroyltriglutamate--homocysteine methyltransferase
VLGAPLQQRRRLTEHEASFLKQHAPGPFKVTMPAASYVASRAYNPEISDRVFGSRRGLLMAVAEIIQAEIKQLVAEGVPYIQLDNPHYTDFVSDDIIDQYNAAGIDPDQALRDDVDADNACLQGFDRSGVTLAMHYCRGNTAGGGFHKAGGYDRVAEVTFGGLKVDALLLEYDSDRAGSFEPLRFVPRGKTAVLGLITTKSGALENPDDLKRRVEEATKYVAIEDLALSPQCGFASTFEGNPLTPEEQRRKLELVVETARQIWK